MIFRRAFASRIFPDAGLSHVRGVLVHGPPGCGKMLIARQIGKVLNSRLPKIVNGHEVLDKYVGWSEKKIRDLFAEMENEQLEMGGARRTICDTTCDLSSVNVVAAVV